MNTAPCEKNVVVNSIVQDFEHITAVNRSKNDELQDFVTSKSIMKQHRSPSSTNSPKEVKVSFHAGISKQPSLRLHHLSKLDDFSENTADETELSDSFSLSSSSSHHRSWQHWHPTKSNVNRLPTVPLEENSSSSDQSSTDCFAEENDDDDFPTDIDEWNLVKILGEGYFGQVWQTERDQDDRCYALKCLSKYQLVCDDHVSMVIDEKNIMMKLKHPFIIKLRAAWQDENLIYLLQDFIQGGELYSLMLDDDCLDAADRDSASVSLRNALPEKNVQFYAACIADALSYMHKRHSIVYRDLKSENVLLDVSGYPVLIDLGAAKILSDDDDKRTYTLVGTPRYVAPEQILGSGHSFGVDHWALAVLVFEMLSGEHPFDDCDGMDEVALYSCITDEEPTELPPNTTLQAKDWIDQLLVKDPDQRLGSHDCSELLSHSWLSDFDLPALRRRTVEAPWVPALQSLSDSSHFDDWDHLEPVVRPEYPKLTVREAAMFAAFDKDS